MYSPLLDSYFMPYDPIEQTQVKTGAVDDVQSDFHGRVTPKLPSHGYFDNGNLFITKHHRFASVPAHTHSFVEINYMYRGECTQYINGEPIHLQTGDIILLDKDVVQAIDEVGDCDLLINILIQDDTILTHVLNHLTHSDSLVTNFMLNAARIDAIHNNFIVFNARHHELVLTLIHALIMKSFSHDLAKMREMNAIFGVLLDELAQCIEFETHHFLPQTDALLPILDYIDTHYREVTLTELARHFGYNANYLSNKLKHDTHHTFHELVAQKRLRTALHLLTDTQLPIYRVADAVGYSNGTSLLRMLKKYGQPVPSAIRDAAQTPHR